MSFSKDVELRKMALHVAVKVRILEEDPGKFSPWASKEDGARALYCRAIDHIPVGVVRRPARCGNPSVRHRLSRQDEHSARGR